MASKESRNTVLYLVGIALLIGAMLYVVIRISDNSISFLSPTSSKTYSTVPAQVISTQKSYQATLKTTKGNIVIDLFAANAPTTVNNFVFLARDNYYDGVTFHRVVKDFIIQSGSRLSMDTNPNNDGLGGPGYRFGDENNWDSISLEKAARDELSEQGFTSNVNVKSVVIEKYSLAMANAGPNTNGSQFFIVTGATDSDSVKALRGKHTVFGKVVAGMDIVDAINNADLKNTASDSPSPLQSIFINDVEIVEK